METTKVNIVDFLIYLDNRSHQDNITKIEYCKIGKEIKRISDEIIKDYGIYNYMFILQKIQTKNGRTLSPLDSTIVKQLVKEGCVVSNMRRCVEYAK